MATTQQSRVDFALMVPLSRPKIVPSGPDVAGEARKALRQRTFEPALLNEIARWELVTAGSTDALAARWKVASKRIGEIAERFREVIAAGNVLQGDARVISDNLTLIRAALLESYAAIAAACELPYVSGFERDGSVPRAYALAAAYLHDTSYDFDAAHFADFLASVQNTIALQMSEVWNLKSFLDLALLEHIAEASEQLAIGPSEQQAGGPGSGFKAAGEDLSILVQSLQQLSELEWKEFFEQTAAPELVLRGDPQGAYERMDFQSREAYRAMIRELARDSDCTEQEVAKAAIDLAHSAQRAYHSSERVSQRRAHVGYYLIGPGQKALRKAIGYRPAVLRRIREAVLRWSDFFYLIGIELATLAVIALLVSFSHVRPLSLLAVVLFVLPAMECAVTTMNLLATRLFSPKRLPRLDFSKGIPDDCVTVVAVPTLLTSEAQVRSAVHGLEIRFLANRDRNLHFALLTDPPDSTQEFDDKDRLAGECSRLIDELNQKYGPGKGGSFFHFHRHRAYNPSEGLWMGWERKRGKLLDFNRFLLHQSDQFPIKTGDLSLLSHVRYVITLDLDTQLPADAGRRLVGTLAHPLNRAVMDPITNTVVEGYGILQPRVDISIRSASRSRFAALLSGDTGVDFYTRAVSDVYQDLFGEGIFTGKGIYEVEAFHKVLEHRFPCNAILSHDLIEGVYARSGLVSDIEVVDDYPSHFSAYSRRKHRWVRGDWQIIFGLLPRVRNYFGKLVRNPLSHISRWKIIDNLRRSLMDCAIFLLLLSGWLWLPGAPGYWTLAALAVMLFPTYFHFVLTVLTARGALSKAHFWKNLCADFVTEHSRVFFRLTFLCHQTLVSLDAVIRTLIRMKFTHKGLLQWETAADAEVGTGESLVDVYLKWSPAIALAIAALVFLARPDSLTAALPVLTLWALSNRICKWLNQPQRSGESRIEPGDRAFIRSVALRTWRFFREYSTEEENWLVPDIVQQAPPLVAHRISTTNLGLLLSSRLAALDFGFLTLREFVEQTAQTLETVERMPKFKGQLYNWYTTDTLEPVEPLFVSTVDNGNLLASLWTLKHGCLDLLHQPVFRPTLWRGIHDLIDLLVELAAPSGDAELVSATNDLRQRVRELSGPELNRFDVLATLEIDVAIFVNKASKGGVNAEISWWAHELSLRVANLKHQVEDIAPWLLVQFSVSDRFAGIEDMHLLERLTLESAPQIYEEVRAKLGGLAARGENADEFNLLCEALQRSNFLAEGIKNRLVSLAESIGSMAEQMDFAFLYEPKKKLLSIGYDGAQGVVSRYHYDLLASEARAAVFVAIAKGDIPQESWFELGRSSVIYKGQTVLRSWTGTAFEYLMPFLWIRTYPNTLLERAARGAIRAQRRFVDGLGIPWGISESACNQRNPDGHYRYHAFGVPDLAINRDDCSGDVVIAPYATFLVLPFEGPSAVKNLKKMKELGWLSAYGFYEAADFSPRRVLDSSRHEIVRNWMAHHQGMTLLAVANALCDSVMLRRFHAEPCVAAHERLLHERSPRMLVLEDEIPETAPKRRLRSMGQTKRHAGLHIVAQQTQ
jgi:cyclic beta-1,2-glucan synthetase